MVDTRRGLKYNKRFKLDVSQIFSSPLLIIRIIKHWTKLPREIAESESLAVFNSRLDKNQLTAEILLEEVIC